MFHVKQPDFIAFWQILMFHVKHLQFSTEKSIKNTEGLPAFADNPSVLWEMNKGMGLPRTQY